MKTKQKNVRIKSVALVNAEHMAKQHPETFHVPDNRTSLRVGDLAKVCCEGERFWCQIAHVKEGIYDGIVDNHLIAAPLKYGDRIQFLPCNVHSCMSGNEFLD